MGKRITHEDLMKRLDDLMKRLDEMDKRNITISKIILFFSIAVALLIGSYSTNNILFIFLGVCCYAFSILLLIFKGIKY
ncbi:MAG: hypothetical protein KAJ44_02320 [Thermoplasmatales archaeon]|nr:hypothetical protein [Thermoplasmatales archaeon]